MFNDSISIRKNFDSLECILTSAHSEVQNQLLNIKYFAIYNERTIVLHEEYPEPITLCIVFNSNYTFAS